MKSQFVGKQFYANLASYIVIIVLSVVCNIAGYSAAIKVIERQTASADSSVIENTSYSCDIYFKSIVTSLNRILLSENVKKISGKNISDYERMSYTDAIITEITRESVSDTVAVVLFGKNVCIQSNMGISTVDGMYDAYYNKYFPSKQDWLDKIKSTSGIACYPAVYRSGSGGSGEDYTMPASGEKTLFIVYRLPNVNADAAVVVRADRRYLTNLLRTDSADANIMLITDNDGNTVMAGDSKYDGVSVTDGDFAYIDGGKYIVSERNSTVLKLRYYRLANYRTYLRDISSVRRTFIIGYLMCVVIGLALSWLFSLIYQNQKRRLENQIARHERYAFSGVLRQILTSRMNLANIPDEYMKYFTSDRYCVLVFDISENVRADGEYEAVSSDAMIKFLEKKFDDMYTMGRAHLCPINDMCVCLLSLDNPTMLIDRVGKCAQEICDAVSREMSVDIRCAVSRIANGIADLPEAYEQTQEIINLRFLGDDKTVYVYDDAMQSYQEYNFNSETMSKLIDSVLLGKYDAAKSVIDGIFDFATSRMTLGNMRVITADIIKTLLTAACQIDESGSVDSKQLYMESMYINNVASLKRIHGVILDYTASLCRLASQRLPEKSDHKYSNIEAYIKENFSNPDLNVNMIADVFDISRPWLSKTFREKMGISISDYIVKCRLDKAKEMLKTGMTVSQISQAVGFSSEVVYCRAFKKYEGITSMQYRQLIQIKDNER